MSETEDPELRIARRSADRRKLAFKATARLLRLRLDPRLIVADLAQRTASVAIARVASPVTTPKQRRRAIATGVVAVLAAVGFQRWSLARAKRLRLGKK